MTETTCHFLTLLIEISVLGCFGIFPRSATFRSVLALRVPLFSISTLFTKKGPDKMATFSVEGKKRIKFVINCVFLGLGKRYFDMNHPSMALYETFC